MLVKVKTHKRRRHWSCEAGRLWAEAGICHWSCEAGRLWAEAGICSDYSCVLQSLYNYQSNFKQILMIFYWCNS